MTNLHRCVDCAYWQPALTYYGEPTGQGGCRFSVARNRKGDKPRECEHYLEKQKTNPGIDSQGEKSNRTRWLMYMLGYMTAKGWSIPEENAGDFREAFPEIPDGYIKMVVDKGPPSEPVLARQQRAGGEPELVRQQRREGEPM